MNNITTNLTRFIPVSIPFIIGASLILFLRSSFFLESPEVLSTAITIDFLITIPLLYFLIIRKRAIPKITVVSVFVLGVLTLSIFLPKEHSFLLDTVKYYFIPLLELAIFGFLIYKVRQLSKNYQKTSNDFYTNLKEATLQTFPKKLAVVLTTEVSVIYYGFIKWKSPKLSKNEFSYHQKNGLVSILIGFIMMIIAETIGVHALLVKNNPVLSWILFVLSCYTAMQIFALAKSLAMRPYVVDENEKELHLRYGFFVDTKIPIQKIERVELSSKDLPEDKSIVSFSPFGSLGEHNVILHLKEEIRFSGIYGIPRKGKSLAIFVDEQGRFTTLLEELLKK